MLIKYHLIARIRIHWWEYNKMRLIDQFATMRFYDFSQIALIKRCDTLCKKGYRSDENYWSIWFWKITTTMLFVFHTKIIGTPVKPSVSSPHKIPIVWSSPSCDCETIPCVRIPRSMIPTSSYGSLKFPFLLSKGLRPSLALKNSRAKEYN